MVSGAHRRSARDQRGATRKTMIVALARTLLIALWRRATLGEIPQGVMLRLAPAPSQPHLATQPAITREWADPRRRHCAGSAQDDPRRR
jgi:hypothetical protein